MVVAAWVTSSSRRGGSWAPEPLTRAHEASASEPYQIRVRYMTLDVMVPSPLVPPAQAWTRPGPVFAWFLPVDADPGVWGPLPRGQTWGPMGAMVSSDGLPSKLRGPEMTGSVKTPGLLAACAQSRQTGYWHRKVGYGKESGLSTGLIEPY